MTDEELVAIKEMHPTALSIWYDRMYELNHEKLIETLLVMMSASELLVSIGRIENDMAAEREIDDGPE